MILFSDAYRIRGGKNFFYMAVMTVNRNDLIKDSLSVRTVRMEMRTKSIYE